MASIKVQSPNTCYTKDYIEAKYTYEITRVDSENGQVTAIPEKLAYTFRVQRKVILTICKSIKIFLINFF